MILKRTSETRNTLPSTDASIVGKMEAESLSRTVVAAVEGVLTRLLLFGPAGGFVGLAPDGDPVLQELQRSPLLPVRRAHLQAQTAHLLDLDSLANAHSCQQVTFTMLEPCNICFTSSSSCTPAVKSGRSRETAWQTREMLQGFSMRQTERPAVS